MHINKLYLHNISISFSYSQANTGSSTLGHVKKPEFVWKQAKSITLYPLNYDKTFADGLDHPQILAPKPPSDPKICIRLTKELTSTFTN